LILWPPPEDVNATWDFAVHGVDPLAAQIARDWYELRTLRRRDGVTP
jgi:hypothetical protein